MARIAQVTTGALKLLMESSNNTGTVSPNNRPQQTTTASIDDVRFVFSQLTITLMGRGRALRQ